MSLSDRPYVSMRATCSSLGMVGSASQTVHRAVQLEVPPERDPGDTDHGYAATKCVQDWMIGLLEDFIQTVVDR